VTGKVGKTMRLINSISERLDTLLEFNITANRWHSIFFWCNSKRLLN